MIDERSRCGLIKCMRCTWHFLLSRLPYAVHLSGRASRVGFTPPAPSVFTCLPRSINNKQEAQTTRRAETEEAARSPARSLALGTVFVLGSQQNGRERQDPTGQRHLPAGGATAGASGCRQAPPRRRRRRPRAHVYGGGSGGEHRLRKVPRPALCHSGELQHCGGHGDHAVGGGVSRDPLRVASGRLAGGAGVHYGVFGLHGVRRAGRLRGGQIRPLEGGVRRFRVERLLLPAHLLCAVLRLVRLPAQHGRLRRGRRVAGVRAEDRVHPDQAPGRPAASGRRLLDVRLHADHRAGHVGGAHAGLEVDDPHLGGAQRGAPLPLQVHSRVGSLQRVGGQRRGRRRHARVDRQDEQSLSAARASGGHGREGERQLEAPAQFGLQEDVLASLVLVVSRCRKPQRVRSRPFIRFVASFAYYGAVLSGSELLEKNLLCVTDGERARGPEKHPEAGRCYCVPFAAGDYRTLLISCLGELALIPLNVFLLNTFGRRKSLMLLQSATGLFFLMLSICTSTLGFTFLLLLLRSMVSMNFTAVYIYTAEVYPTVARSLGMGFCTSVSRIGGMIAPFVAQVLMSRSVILALSPFSVACGLCAVGSFLLPIETKGRALLEMS